MALGVCLCQLDICAVLSYTLVPMGDYRKAMGSVHVGLGPEPKIWSSNHETSMNLVKYIIPTAKVAYYILTGNTVTKFHTSRIRLRLDWSTRET